MKYKLVMFDLDGTVLNTLEDLYTSLNYALNKYDFPSKSLKEVRSFLGNGIRSLVKLSMPSATNEEDFDLVFKEFKSYYATHCDILTKPYDGILDLLNVLKEKGYKIAIISNKADFAVQTLVNKYFPNLIDYAVGEVIGVPRKPDPTSLNNVMKYFNIKKSESVYIGDSEVDIEVAKNANVDAIIVTWGFRDEEYLKSLNPNTLVNNTNDLLKNII